MRALVRVSLVLACILVFVKLTGCMERMFYYPQRGATPVPQEFPHGELVRFKSADGTQLTGWFLPSDDPASPRESAATILHVHGNAGNLAGHIGFTEYLPAAGFNLFIFDYRGYGESEGKAIRRAGLIADTNAALDYLLSRDDIDHARIGMYGQSLGGSIGLIAMKQRQEISAAVIESAFTSWRDIAACAVGGTEPGGAARCVAALLIPDGDRPIDAMAAIDRPMLIVHGTADTIIPVAHGRALAEAGRDNVTLIEVEGAEHNSLRWTHPEIERRVIDFLRANLSGVGE